MHDWVEELAGGQVHKYRRAALVCRTIGWMCIFWAAMVSIWIWMGWRAGLELWLWCSFGLTLTGMVLIGAGIRLQAKAAIVVEDPNAAKEDDRIRAA